MYNSIDFSIENGIATIRFNRPETLNSFNFEMANEVKKALYECESDSVRCVILTGTGRGFCAGQDLSELLPSEQNPSPRSITAIVDTYYNPIVTKIRRLEKPVIAMVNGVAAGAGANIALACDFVVASNSTNFVQAFSKIGLIPDSAGTYFLPRIVGLAKATELTFLGEKLSAQEAKELNLIYKVVNDIDLHNETLQLATKLVQMPTKALGFTKMLFNKSFQNTLEQQLQHESEYQTKAGNTADYKEGVSAFLEKRKPNYQGK